MKNKNIMEIIGIVILFIVLFLLILIVPNLNTDINVGKLIINEVMLVNNNTVKDKYGNYSDYIEIYNGNDYDINLYGYYLSDSVKDNRKWAFPDVNIKSHEYLTVFASGKNEVIDDEIHTNFKLDSKGETILLTNNSSEVISKLYVKESYKDTSYGYNGKEYVYYYIGTPNLENNGEYSLEPIYNISNDTDIKITEYIINNLNHNKSFDGKYYSLIELYNNEEQDINLKDYYLSDKEDEVTKYTFPEIVIKSHDYLIVYASGNNYYQNNELHLNFKLNDKDGLLILSSPNKSTVDKIEIKKLEKNIGSGLYKDKWYSYGITSFGQENNDNYLKEDIKNSDILINEVSIYPTEAIELYNRSNTDVNLSGYSISDKSGSIFAFTNQVIKANSYLTLYGSDKKSIGSKLYLGFHINNSNDKIFLYKDNVLVNEMDVHKLTNNVSTGLNNDQKVYYKNITLGKKNSDVTYLGYSNTPIYSIDGGYVEKGTKISLSCDGDIYYTLDGSFPSNKSTKYENEIEINSTKVIKSICYKDGYIESDIVSRTFIIGRKHDVAFISISTNNGNLFGSSGILTNYTSNSEKKISFEFYEPDGSLGTSFIGGVKLSGMDSRKEPQKSMSVYLRKSYGQKDVTYPFFKDSKTINYSSILLRNAGEDPKNVRIQDAVLTRALKGQMDIDMQDYRPVVVYLNGTYYGLYNLREKLNADYVVSKYGIEKDKINVIKYQTAVKGSISSYNSLVNYIKSHNCAKKDVYEYIKTQLDVEELCNYWIVESFYGNTDLGNIRYWKENGGKWRFMLYDLDWSLWNYSLRMSYPVISGKIPAATYLSSSINIARNLYKNSEFRDLYLKTLAKHLKETFKPDRMNSIIDELAKEIETEMPYHINKWGSKYSNLNSMSRWRNNLSNFKTSLKKRYNSVVKNLKSDFNLSNNDYKKYFGDL